MINILPYGDSALLVNFEQRIDRQIHSKVTALQERMHEVIGVMYMVPSYCALTIVFDKTKTTFSSLERYIASTEPGIDAAFEAQDGRQIRIPVCYGGDFGPDLEDVCQQTGKPSEEIIATHTGQDFYAYMLGFQPGFAYMGDLPRPFFCHRKPTPRTRVPAGSVGLAGLQTAVYPFESPGGWQIIGRTPLKMFDPQNTPPNLIQAGDRIRFNPVTPAEYDRLSSRNG